MTQAQALAIMKTGLNIYLTGSAGSGKTHTLRAYIEWLKEHDITVAITASTGIAATHMNGQTIHGWSGIGIREKLTQRDLDDILQKQYLWTRFKNVKVLIIDEVSMLHANTLDMVEQVCRNFKGNDLPFGGIQVILSGDFFQLPPVSKNKKQDEYDQSLFDEENTPVSDLLVHSNAWKKMKPAICYLTEQHRQEDPGFLEILNAIRANNIEDKHLDSIMERIGADELKIPPVKLYTHNEDVDAINMKELKKLDGDEKEFVMSGQGNDVLISILKKSVLAKENLFLKTGAEVMFIKNNFEAGYVNGTRGIVKGFDYRGEPVVEIYTSEKRVTVSSDEWRIEENGKVKAKVIQYPLRLAWAITIHKSQGMSLDCAEIDLSKTFAYGMGYVALSRVRTLKGVCLVGFKRESLAVDPEAFALDEKMQGYSEENEELFTKLPKKELDQMENDFILRSGGKVFAQPQKEKKEKIKKPKKEPSPEYAEKMAKKREQFPNAGKKWAKDEDTILMGMFNKKKSIEEISQALGRNENSIGLRLVAHGLMEPTPDMKDFLDRQSEKQKEKKKKE